MVFAGVWPLSTVGTTPAARDSPASNTRHETDVSVQASDSTPSSSFPSVAADGSTPNHVTHHPALSDMVAPLAPEALLDAVNEGSVSLVNSLLSQEPSLANHRDGFGQVSGCVREDRGGRSGRCGQTLEASIRREEGGRVQKGEERRGMGGP